MKKFIRTADGRIVDTEKEYEPLQWAEQARDYSLTVAEANTIEELCDEFVAINPNNKNVNYITRAPLHSLYEIEYKKYKRIVYGAIYTDKGLTYVAKLNENGELELI